MPTATTYNPPAELVIHEVDGQLDNRETAPQVVHVMQYDNNYPIVAVHLLANHQPYTIPNGASVNIRMRKPDGKNVYNPALGVSSDRQTAYIAITLQMTAVHGRSIANVEIMDGDRVIGTASMVINIDPNPIQSNDIESSDEYKTLLDLIGEAEKFAEDSKSQADRSKQEADKSASEAEKSKTEADRAKAEADKSASEAEKSKTEAEKAKTEADRSNTEADRAGTEADRSGTEADRAGTEADRAKGEADKAEELRESIEVDYKALEEAKKSAQTSAEQAETSKDEAAGYAETAKQYSGKPPVIIDGTWWTWDADLHAYTDTGVRASELLDENSGESVRMWFGTIAEYNALNTIEPDVYYNILEGRP